MKQFKKMKKQKQSKKPAGDQARYKTSIIYYLAVLGAVFGAWLIFVCLENKAFAPRSDFITSKIKQVSCSSDYKKYPIFEKCTPATLCARCVKDGLISESELDTLTNLAKNGFSYGGSFGGASILDLHSGALSAGGKFINIYQALNESQLSDLFSGDAMKVYEKVKNKIKGAVTNEFGVDPVNLFLTKPTFFSKMTSKPAYTKHDEYWHSHIDKVQYGSFDYTSLLYLSDYGSDFEGGRFVFDDKNDTIEPKLGRVSFFTSGSENPHHVEKVIDGTRYAMTVSFTCDPKHSIENSLWQ
uniref:2-oxoglutarate and iron-dependent oxygenase domain-containing protein 3-like n=1 Tax=Phallusia mammillata TaxID=59560 RepID=A0A6F9DNK1_9ASCI|nr:2-oxoglutarate and iron-dependent oxygenase domain-containing protein 3-like [Phallusia mammillata]